MSEKPQGGAAFPCMPPTAADSHGGAATGYPFPDPGMTLRQWYAGQVIVGVVGTMAAPAGGHSGMHLGEHLCDAVEEIVDAMIRRFA